MKNFLTAFVAALFLLTNVAHAEDATTYNNRGVVYEKLKQYERAFQEYSKALQLNPNSAKFYNNRERCLKAMGR